MVHVSIFEWLSAQKCLVYVFPRILIMHREWLKISSRLGILAFLVAAYFEDPLNLRSRLLALNFMNMMIQFIINSRASRASSCWHPLPDPFPIKFPFSITILITLTEITLTVTLLFLSFLVLTPHRLHYAWPISQVWPIQTIGLLFLELFVKVLWVSATASCKSATTTCFLSSINKFL